MFNHILAPPAPSHQMKGGGNNGGGGGSGNSVANSTSTSSSSSSNNGSPIKEIPSIGSTNYSRVSHSVSVPLNLFHVMQKPSDLESSLPATSNRSEIDLNRYIYVYTKITSIAGFKRLLRRYASVEWYLRLKSNGSFIQFVVVFPLKPSNDSWQP